MAIPDALTSSNSQDWATPKHVFKKMQGKYPYTIDLAATKTSKKCRRYIGLDKGQDSLKIAWHKKGKFGWLNPPYGDKKYPLKLWAKKAYEEAKKGFITTMLVPITKQDQKWFHDYVIGKAEVLIVKGRIHFVDPKTGKRPVKWSKKRKAWVMDGNSHGSMLITWGPEIVPKMESISFKEEE